MKLHLSRISLAVLAAAILTLAAHAATYTEATLYNFHGQKDGNGGTGLVADSSGNLYVATVWGGGGCSGKGCGAVFQFTPSSTGYKETLLHAFTGPTDGENPEHLLIDAAGNLYGTTFVGGVNNGGTLWELSPSSSGWTFATLYAFNGNTQGGSPTSLTFDAAGNLWGTGSGGTYGYGTVFELTPNSSGGWDESVIYSFTGGQDGNSPESITFDAAGNAYGGVYAGGDTVPCFGGCGTIYRLQPSGSSWTFGLLYTFHGPGGSNPIGGMLLDAAGNLYGATRTGGHGYGVVFQLAPTAIGQWKETILHSFLNGTDGATPGGGLTFDSAGNLYGAADGVNAIAPSPVFRLTKSATGGWIFAVVYTFPSSNAGSAAAAPSYIDASGNLYGTAGGGTGSEGIVYELTP